MCNCNQAENQMPAGRMQSGGGMPPGRMNGARIDSMPDGNMVSGAGGSMPRLEMNAAAGRTAENVMRAGGGMPGSMPGAEAKGGMSGYQAHVGGGNGHGHGHSVMPEPDGRN